MLNSAVKLNPVFPVIRVSVQVHNGYDIYTFSLSGIKNPKRKSPQKASSDITVQRRPNFRIGKGPLNRRIYFYGKIISETFLIFVIMLDCLDKLSLCFRMK